MTATIIVLILTVAFFIWGRIRSDVVAITALAALLCAGVLTPAEALAGFSSTIVAMMVGLFIVGGAILRTGLAQTAGRKLMTIAKGNETLTFVLVMVATSFIGAFVSNTGTVALMMPIVISMAVQGGFQASRILMPLAFAGSLGGMLTLIGTPPNLVISDTLVEHGYEGLSFFSFFPVGLICVGLGIVVLMPLSRWFLTKKDSGKKSGDGRSLADLMSEYQLKENVSKYRVDEGSALDGKTIRDLDLMNSYGVTIIEIRSERKLYKGLIHDVSQKAASPTTVLQAGDIIYFLSRKENVERLAEECQLTRMDGSELNFYDLGLAELVVMQGSRLEGMRISESKIREHCGVNILAIRRNGDYLTEGLSKCRLHNGDVLLVQGDWKSILTLNNDNQDWVLIGRPEQTAGKVLLDYKAPTAAAIMLAMIAMMVFDFIPVAPVTAVMIAAVLTVVTGCFRNVEDAYRTINWESIMLIAAMMPMSTALEKTGVSSLVSQTLVDSLGQFGPTALLAGIYFTTSLLTMFISNTATAVLMAPIAMVAAQQIGVSPYPFLFAVTLGASMCFASPFSTPPNALVMKAGNYTFMDYVKVGLPLQLVIGIVMVFVLPLLFPLKG
jgi:di/tricarboxylate transporter